MKHYIDRNADREDYDKAEMRAEMEEQIKNELLKICQPDELEDFTEWIEDNGYMLYWNRMWIKTKTGKVISLEKMYAIYKNILRAV